VSRLLVVRHAQSVWNGEGRWQGWADPPLSPLGAEQAKRGALVLAGLAATLGRPQRVVASDLQRAVRTAEHLGAAFGLGVELDPDLREYDAGAWTGLRRDEISARWPTQLAAWDADGAVGPPGGEDPGHFSARLAAAVERIARPGPDCVVVVSHGRAIHQLAAGTGAAIGRVGNLEGWVLDVEPARPGVLVAPLRLVEADPAGPGSVDEQSA